MARTANLKCLIDPVVKDRLDKLLERKNLKLTQAMESLIRWLLDQDSLLQSMLVGGVEPKDYPDVAEKVLARLRTGRFDQVLDERDAPGKSPKQRPRLPAKA